MNGKMFALCLALLAVLPPACGAGRTQAFRLDSGPDASLFTRSAWLAGARHSLAGHRTQDEASAAFWSSLKQFSIGHAVAVGRLPAAPGPALQRRRPPVLCLHAATCNLPP